jgi:DNA-binding MarR family transcriptional regulator
MTASILTGQIIGQAQYATRAVLDELLARHSTTFYEWIVLNVTGVNGGTVEEDTVVDRMTASLRVDAATVHTAATGLVEAGLLTLSGEPARLQFTDLGRERFDQISAGIAEITATLYGDLSTADLEATRRVLDIVTKRANAALAG